MPDEREKFTLADMLSEFDIQRVSLGGPVFDVEKLSWLNGLWIREDFSDEELADRLADWALNRRNLLQVLPHAKQRMETFSDLAPLAGFLVSGQLRLGAGDFAELKITGEELLQALQFVLWRLESQRHWTRDNVFSDVKCIADAMGIKMKDFLAPFFVAVCGSTASFSVFDAMVLLGPDMSRARIRSAIDVLGGISKKAMKRLEKAYREVPERD
jgi:glutamyl-tRNA synthetase